MKLPEKFWVYAKISFIFAYFIFAFINKPTTIESGDSPPPFWITIIPLVFFSLFLPPFLRAFKSTEQYLKESPWPRFPFSCFDNPFPFWHFVTWCSLTAAVPQTYHALTPYNHDQLVMALFMWSCGFGALLGIARVKRGLKRNKQR